MPPVTRWWSEWNIPVASLWILTSSLTGSPISISSIDHGWLNSQMRAPFVFTTNLLSSNASATRRPRVSSGMSIRQLHARQKLRKSVSHRGCLRASKVAWLRGPSEVATTKWGPYATRQEDAIGEVTQAVVLGANRFGCQTRIWIGYPRTAGN